MFETLDRELAGLIDSSEYVLFDVFDTLLERPFVRPVDLFGYLEHVSGLKGFAKRRRECESEARRNSTGEVSLSDIYSLMPKEFSTVMDTEVSSEIEFSRAVSSIREVWDYCVGASKKILILSDMYLGNEVISQMLQRSGYTGYLELFVSCDCNLTKESGELYQSVIEKYGIDPKSCLMIGDHPKSDNSVPQGLGIHSYRWLPNRERYFAEYKHLLKYYRKCSDWAASYMLASSIITRSKSSAQDYWYRWGVQIAGPICFSFCKWIYDNTKHLDSGSVLFIARDGYLLKKIFDRMQSVFGGSLDTEYIYAPRIVWTLKQIQDNNYLIPEEYAEVLANHFSISAYELKDGPKIRELIDRDCSNYADYLHCKQTSSPVVIVDSITSNYSSQNLIEEYLGTGAKGFYWKVNNRPDSMDVLSYQPDSSSILLSWNIMEFIFSSPESIIRHVYPDHIEYYPSNGPERIRSESFSRIAAGVLDFCSETIKSPAGGISVSNDLITTYINEFLANPTVEDKENISNILFSSKMDGSDAKSLDPYSTPLFYTLKKMKRRLLH